MIDPKTYKIIRYACWDMLIISATFGLLERFIAAVENDFANLEQGQTLVALVLLVALSLINPRSI